MVPPVMNDKIMSLPRGWIVVYKDGSVVVEGDLSWRKVVKRNINCLSLKWGEKFWTITGKSDYVCFNRHCVNFSTNGSYSEVSERCIGYYDDNGEKVVYRVDELTGNMRLSVVSG